PATVARLVNMGVAPFNIVSTLHLVLAQRLARTLHSCRKLEKVEEEKLLAIGFEEEEIAEGIRIYGPGECDQCTGGYKGRTGVFQVMPISEEMEKIILNNGGAIEIAHQADTEGVIDLRRAALNKVKQGMISLNEMNRVTKD
ncbi:MAG TPA: type IV-A pilus assembly ATPase PilB, partial [Wenzhouxiangella sp.]|nr:type IV-A pilus assembly ATPase PilB [Wenzhouxiangella sp.]